MSVERHSDRYRPAHRGKRANKIRGDQHGSKLHGKMLRQARLMRRELRRGERDAV